LGWWGTGGGKTPAAPRKGKPEKTVGTDPETNTSQRKKTESSKRQKEGESKSEEHILGSVVLWKRTGGGGGIGAGGYSILLAKKRTS